MSDDLILMAHGGGGELTRQLLAEIVIDELGNPILDTLDDSACLDVPETDLLLTTDSYVVDPVFFPGGDIGKLSVCGTVNDIAMQGGEPRYLSLGLIIEEGFSLDDLRRVVCSIREASEEAGVNLVRLHGDKILDKIAKRHFKLTQRILSVLE